MSMILDGTNGATFNDGSLQAAAASPYVLKNRIINGAMVIDQRNAGASVTPSTDSYNLDRWKYEASQASKFTIQQNKGSVTPPTGFSNYLGMSVASAVTVGAGDYFGILQAIEGFNTADLAWGTANAKTVTLSFQIYSSLTGTFGGALRNSATNRSYPFTYTISSANTWTTINITIAGDTTGTWLTTNGSGIVVFFSLGVGSTFSGTAGAWTAGNFVSATGAVSVVGTASATFYITGVQLEQNTSATPFERRLYDKELVSCQRYFYRNVIHYSGCIGGGSGTIPFGGYSTPVTMRATPTATWNSGGTADNGSSGFSITSLNTFIGSPAGGYLAFNIGSNATIGRGCTIYDVNMSFSSEL